MSFISLLLYIIAVYLRPQEWLPAMNGWPLIYILTITTAIFVILETPKRKQTHLTAPPNLLMLGFLGCILFSHISNGYLQGTIDSFNDFAPNVVMFFLFVNILTTERKIKIAIWLIIILTVILAIEGIQQHYKGIGWAGQTPYLDKERQEFRIRWIGIFNDPNDLALVFVIGIGFLMSFLFGKLNFLIKVTSIIMLFTIGYALFYTNSRGGFLALSAMILFIFLRRMKNKLLSLSLGGLLAFIVILFGPSRMSDMSASEASAYGRIESWYQGFQMLKSAPIFGVGYRMFADYHFQTAHNSYILIAAETGIVGLFVWLSLVYLCFKGLVIVGWRNYTSKSYLLGLEAALVGFMSAGYFLSRSYIMVLYLLLALAASFEYINLRKEEYAFTRKDRHILLAVTMGTLALLWFSMRFLIK